MPTRSTLLLLLLGLASGATGCAEDEAPSTPIPQAPTPKRGVAYGFQSAADLRALSPRMAWWYNWSPRPDVAAAAGDPEFVPMVWGGDFVDEDVVAAIPPGSRYLLTFNEPNFHAQANLTAAQAAALWPRIERIAERRGLELVSPAVNFCGGGCNETDPFAYLDAFFAACDGCRVDYVAAHWYACSGGALTWYLQQLKKYGRPIWLTEFACGDGDDRSLDAQQRYMEEAVALLEADPSVFRYAWFSGRTRAIPNVDLLGAEGQPTALGGEYVRLPGANDARP